MSHGPDGPVYIWIVYAIEDAEGRDRFGLRLEWMTFPNEDLPGTFRNPPEEVAGIPTFVYPPGTEVD